MSQILFYDTETTGLPLWGEPSDHPDQPRIVQLCADLCDAETGRSVASMNVVIRPDGWEIPEAASAVHGISTEMAARVGVPIDDALRLFLSLWLQCEFRVGHNESFDARMLRIEMMRTPVPVDPNMLDAWKGGRAQCTQALSTPILNIPPTARMLAAGRRHAKSPNLGEAYQHFMGSPIDGAHTAAGDVAACKAIYYAIQQKVSAP